MTPDYFVVGAEYISVTVLFAFLTLRLTQRLYYIFKGHVHYWTFEPFDEMESFLKSNNITVTDHSFLCERDYVRIRYRRLGKGPKTILLANGVGTAFYMWLPVFREICKANPRFFDEVTLLAPVYRGLFGSDIETPSVSSTNDDKIKPSNKKSASKNTASATKKSNTSGEKGQVEVEVGVKEVEITMENCVADIRDLMQQTGVKKFDCVIGWSMGAQTALTLCAQHPEAADSLFLLNPATGQTLHRVLQTVAPLPEPLGKAVSSAVRGLHFVLRPLIKTPVWDVLKVVFDSPVFRGILEISAFFGGFPPEQPPYFHAYMKDVFSCRNQTRGLLDLIVALDAPCPSGALTLPHRATIVTGLPDVMTGVYHGWNLARGMSNARHVMFTMGSHFVILEWPELCAAEILSLIIGDGSVDSGEAAQGGGQRGAVGKEKERDQHLANTRGQNGKANKLVKKTK